MDDSDRPSLEEFIGGYEFPKVTGTALILANLFPLFGVFFASWNAYDIVIIFWLENVVIGLFNMGKIACVEFNYPTMPLTADQARRRKILMVVSFPIHYGVFTAAHGVMILVSFSGVFGESSLFDDMNWLTLTLAGLITSHGVSFVYNYLGREEYRKIDDETLMLGPYGRVIVMQVTVIFGGMFVTLTGSPVSLLILLIIVKIAVDLYSHNAERKKILKREYLKIYPPKPKSFLNLPSNYRRRKRSSDTRYR